MNFNLNIHSSNHIMPYEFVYIVCVFDKSNPNNLAQKQLHNLPKLKEQKFDNLIQQQPRKGNN